MTGATPATGVGTARGRLTWIMLGLAVVAVGAGTAEYLVAVSARVWVANAAWLSSSLVAVVGVAVAWRRSTPGDRTGWALLGWGCAAWVVGELFWIFYELTGYPPSPNLADLCWLGFGLFASAGVLSLGTSARGRRVSWLELLPLAVAVCALVAALLWHDIRASVLTPAGDATAFAYPFLYVFAALVMLQSVVTGTLDLRANRGLALLLAGLVVAAIGFLLWMPQLLTASYVAGTHAVDAFWTLGMLLVGFGAATARPAEAYPNVEQISSRRGAVLPSITFAILALVQAILIVSDAPAGAVLTLCLGLAITGATLGTRAAKLRSEQAALYARLESGENELRHVNERLSQESRRDSLTGLANRLRLDEDLAQLTYDVERNGRCYCLVLCDLDRFKDYNDALGHQAGDGALRQVATLLDDATRGGDRVYRYGGEELLLILRDQDAHAAAAVAERHRANLEAAAMPHPRNPPAGVVTFSAGVAAAQPGETVNQVLRRADAALYRAKSCGRNQIAVAAPEPLRHALAATTT